MPQKAKSLTKSKGLTDDAQSLMKSHDALKTSNMSTEFSLSRAKSTIVPNSSTISSPFPAKVGEPKVMKYVKNTSCLFNPLTPVEVAFNCERNVTFFKGVHELDGFTYILKKIKIFLKNDEDIKRNIAYKELLRVKDIPLPVDIHYVSSWVELDKSDNSENSENNEGISVLLCIQMRYISDKIKLIKDLLILSNNYLKNYDEDTVYDMSEDICDQTLLEDKEKLIKI